MVEDVWMNMNEDVNNSLLNSMEHEFQIDLDDKNRYLLIYKR